MSSFLLVNCTSVKAGEKHTKIFPTQGSILGLLHRGQVLYPLSHQGSLIKHKAGEKHSKVYIFKKHTYYTYVHMHINLSVYKVEGTSLAVPWLRLHLPTQGVQVRSLLGELRFHMLSGQTTKTWNRSTIATKSIENLEMGHIKNV